MLYRFLLIATLLVAACGSATEATSDAGSDASVDGSAGSAGAVSGTGGFGGIGFDSSGDGGGWQNPWADAGVIEAGHFDCQGCLCNGATSFCYLVSAGAAALRDLPLDAPACTDASFKGCTALPPDCAGAPSCACLGKVVQIAPCTCSDTGGGLTVQCNLP